MFSCGKLPTAQPGGNDFGDDDEYGDGDGDGATYIAVYSSVGESMQVIETEHFLAAVSIGKPLELSEFYSDSFDLNNGFDISAPVDE